MATNNPSAEFKEFTRKQMQHYQKMFKHYDSNRDKFIDVEDLRKMMKKLGMSDDVAADAGLMIDEVDEDGDGKLNLREFLLIFRKGNVNKLSHQGLTEIYRQMFIADGEHEENSNSALKEFKDQIDQWSRTEQGTRI